jgi:RHS repeat-associated protein
MKVYSNNSENYGYYGYDDKGERTYKMGFYTTISNTNTYPRNKILWEDRLMLYPNGYININQDGEYTKHYYVDDQRIASKIGTGFMYENGYNSCDLLYNITDFDPSYFDDKRDKPYLIMREKMNEVTDPNNWLGITILYFAFSYNGTFCDFDYRGSSQTYENELYFYQGDHLSSTQVVTDANGNVTQGVLYAPFGEIIHEYNAYWHQGRIPDYMFNAKELDEENGMYYYSARYYNPPMFISRDPLFEKKPWISSYAYCRNNPLIFIDPTGEDEWEINKQGKVKWIKESETHTLFALDGKGNRTGASLTIKDRSIFDGLAESGKNSEYALSIAIGGENSQDAMLQTFKFAADNTDVEWRADRFKEGGKNNYALGTIHNENYSPSAKDLGHSQFSVVAFIHSHPGIDLYYEQGSMGWTGDPTKTYIPSDYHNKTTKGDYKKSVYYTYFPQSGNLWSVRSGRSPSFIKKMNNHRNLFFGTLNTR